MSVNGRRAYRRREVLLAGLATVLSTSACSALSSQRASLDSTRVLTPVLSTARHMVASYEEATTALPQLRASLKVLRDNHSEHVKALAKILGEPADGKADDPPKALSTLAQLRDGESQATTEAVDACAGAPTRFAVLLGEIAACRSTHHDVLGVL